MIVGLWNMNLLSAMTLGYYFIKSISTLNYILRQSTIFNEYPQTSHYHDIITQLYTATADFIVW